MHGDEVAASTEDLCCRGTNCEGQKSFAPSPEKSSGCNDEEDACCGENEEMPRLSCGGGGCCDGKEIKASYADCSRGDDEGPCRWEKCCDNDDVGDREILDDGKLISSQNLVDLLLLFARFRLHVLHQCPH